MMLRSDRTRGSNSETASATATIRRGNSSTKPQRTARRCRDVSATERRLTLEMLASNKRGPPLGELIERHGQYDDDSEENRLNARVNAQKVHCVRQCKKKDSA